MLKNAWRGGMRHAQAHYASPKLPWIMILESHSLNPSFFSFRHHVTLPSLLTSARNIAVRCSFRPESCVFPHSGLTFPPQNNPCFIKVINNELAEVPADCHELWILTGCVSVKANTAPWWPPSLIWRDNSLKYSCCHHLLTSVTSGEYYISCSFIYIIKFNWSVWGQVTLVLCHVSFTLDRWIDRQMIWFTFFF